MGQKAGKKQVKGHSLESSNEEEARELTGLLRRKMTKPSERRERYDTLRHLSSIYFSMGKYRDFLQQVDCMIELASALGDIGLRAEAILNLAQGNVQLGRYPKAVIFCRQIQLLVGIDSKISGYVYLCLGNAYLGLSDFVQCCQNLGLAQNVARRTRDKPLDVLVNISYGVLFVTLRDYDNGLYYYERALDTFRGYEADEETVVMEQSRRLLDALMAVPMFRKGRHNDAMELCEDVLKRGLKVRDRHVQALCMHVFAEIHRKRKDYERAYPRYESAYSIFVEIENPVGQMDCLICMGKVMKAVNDMEQALTLLQKACDIAEKIENQFGLLVCNRALADVYTSLKDSEAVTVAENNIRELMEKIELSCGVCGENMGLVKEELYPLTCGHLIHNRCGPHLARYTWGRKGTRRPCPSCRHKSRGNPIHDV